MKKFIAALFASALLLSIMAVSASASVFDEGEGLTVASFNGVYSFIGGSNRSEELENACWWLADNRKSLSVDYVSFIGRVASSCRHTRKSVMTEQGLSKEELIAMSLEDEDWIKQYRSFVFAISPLADEEIPVGVSVARQDYVSGGEVDRASLQSDAYPIESVMWEDAEYESYDDANLVTFVREGEREYMIFQLELWPRTAVLDWFNGVMSSNPDKYAVICTTSFIDASGEMYTMWDWAGGFKAEGTTSLKAYSMAWTGKARDGRGVWDYSFGKFDNILAIISSNISEPDIVASKTVNERGVEVALIAANAEVAMNKSGTPTLLLTRISPDNTEITCAWAVPFSGVVDTGIKTVKLDKIGTLAEPAVDTSLPKVIPQYNGANKAYILGYEDGTFRPNNTISRAEACTIFARLITGESVIPDGYTTRFEDVAADDWYHDAIAFLDEKGFFYRNEGTVYSPTTPITRAEFVELAALASAIEAKGEIGFKDVSDTHPYYGPISIAASSGLVNGYEDGTFRPDATITRAEAVTVINRLLGLKVSERTVSESRVERVFEDIGGHWARLNVLMASNSNVHGDYYYEASLDGVEESASAYTVSNPHVSIVISKKNGNVTDIINLKTGEDVSRTTQFISISTDKGELILPKKLETEGNRIKVTFKNGAVTYLLVDVHDEYISFEIDSELSPGMASVTFANLSTTLTAAKSDGDYMLNAVGMTAWTNPVNKGYRETASSSVAHAYSKYQSGTMGAKLGIVFSTKKDAIPFLQTLSSDIDPEYGLVSKAGGAWAQEWEGNSGDYVIIPDTDPEKLDETIEVILELGADQVDIHERSATAFRSGDFHFAYTETGTAKEYYEKIGSKFAAAGLETGLHTYAYYITYDSVNILSVPKWQKQLEYSETYTLRSNMSATRTTIPTVEDADGFDLKTAFAYKNTRYILIDEEIIYIGDAIGSGFVKVQRGACGTKATTHSKGAVIYHLTGYFGRFCPVIGSELYYHVADLTAKAYNDGGFDMIYLDAIDGLKQHVASEDVWYYFQMFLHRIVSQCERPPIIETSAGAPQEWNVRGRSGAWDTGNRGIRQYINVHIEANLGYAKNNMCTTLGWFSFFPDEAPVAGLRNTIEKTLFKDDIDALGMGALLYGMSVVYHDFSPSDVVDNPTARENISYYVSNYSKLRKSHYFTPETVERVKAIGGEFTVIDKGEGEYAFLQMYYDRTNLGRYRDVEDMTFEGNNPFAAQTPRIRIEARYSSSFSGGTTLVDFDESAPVGKKTVVKNITPKSLTSSMALTVPVKGTGKDGDAMLISVQSKASTGAFEGRIDYFIDLNFEGWREVVLLDSDNASYDVEKYVFTDIKNTQIDYNTFRSTPNYSRISVVSVRVCGETGHEAMLGDLKAFSHTNAKLTDPTLKIGSSEISFKCNVKSGEYLEFDPVSGKAVLYHTSSQTREDVEYSGTLSVPSGNYTCTLSALGDEGELQRARVTLGFAGQEIAN